MNFPDAGALQASLEQRAREKAKTLHRLSPYQEWVGYPLNVCALCGHPWPCETALEQTS